MYQRLLTIQDTESCMQVLPCPCPDRVGAESAASLVKAEQRMSLEGEGFRSPESAILLGGRRRFCWGGTAGGALCVDRSPAGESAMCERWSAEEGRGSPHYTQTLYLRAGGCGSRESSLGWIYCLSPWWVSSAGQRGALRVG